MQQYMSILKVVVHAAVYVYIKGCSACSSICLYLLIDKYSSNHYLSIILSSDRVNSNNVESRKKLSSVDYYRCHIFTGDTR